jgi:hypothetical protein
MTNITNRIFVDKMGGTQANAYIGVYGEMFYNTDTGSLRLSDGSTVGGKAVSVASANSLFNADLLPGEDNTYALGTSVLRWKSIHIGPGSLYLHDTVSGLSVELTIDAGILKINGSNQLQVGQLKFVDNTIESSTGNTAIQIGAISSSASLVLNRNTSLAIGKTLTVSGNTSITGNFAHNGLDIEHANYVTVTTAGTFVASTTNSKNILIYTAGAVNVTWTMPPNPVDGQVCSWTNSSTSTSVFFITAGPTLVPPISGPYNAGTKFQYVWRASTDKWHDLP